MIIKHHLHADRDLVCSGCTERGYAPSRYEDHECQECRLKFGSNKFQLQMLNDHKRGRTRRVVCLDCYAMLRCHKCKTAYELKYWTRKERDHDDRRGTALFCKACRTLSYHPAELATYSCQTCLQVGHTARWNCSGWTVAAACDPSGS